MEKSMSTLKKPVYKLVNVNDRNIMLVEVSVANKNELNYMATFRSATQAKRVLQALNDDSDMKWGVE